MRTFVTIGGSAWGLPADQFFNKEVVFWRLQVEFDDEARRRSGVEAREAALEQEKLSLKGGLREALDAHTAARHDLDASATERENLQIQARQHCGVCSAIYDLDYSWVLTTYGARA